MAADHTHAHKGYGADNRRRLSIVLALVVTYMIAEVVGGLLTRSLALLADAGHMLSDAVSLVLALFALWLAQRPANARHTYGYYRSEILAALVNGATLVAISIYIFVEAARRFSAPPEVQGALMMSVAMGGLLINVIGLRVLGSGEGENLNLHGAWLHVLTDLLGSIGAVVAGLAIWIFGWNWADPLASVLIGLLVLYAAWNFLRETVAVLMEGAPANLDVDEVREAIRGVPGVRAVHDLHVWTITSGFPALSAHVVVDEAEIGSRMLQRVRAPLHERFGIAHVTIQLEKEGLEEPETVV